MAILERQRAVAEQMLRQAIGWWLTELAGLVPDRLTRRAEHAATVLEVSATGATLVLRGRRAANVTRIPLDGDDMRARAAAAMRGRRDAVTIRLDASMLLETSVSLPPTAQGSLRQILQFQLDRLVPLPPGDISFEYVAATGTAGPGTAGSKTLEAHLLVATRDGIERALGLARGLGLAPRRVVGVCTAAGGQVLTLWRAGRAGATSRGERKLLHALEAITIVLMIAAYGLFLHGLDQQRDQMQLKVDVAVRKTAAARELSRQLARTGQALDLLQQRQIDPPPLMLLRELTEIMPQGSWLTQFIMRGRNVEIIGYSQRVTDLIPLLENSDQFERPQFRSPITLSPDGKGERFDLSFRRLAGHAVTMTPLLRRLLALGILLALLGMFATLVAWPLVRMVTDRQTDIDLLDERLVRLQAMIDRLPELGRRDKDARARLAQDGGLWASGSEAAIAATMQDQLRRMVSDRGGVVKSTAQLRGVTDKGFLKIRVRLGVEGPLDMMMGTLAAMQAARPAMFVEAMTIAAPANVMTVDKPPSLTLDLEISGYMPEPTE